MNCNECREHLGELIYGDTDEPMSVEVERHLAGCDACRAERDGLVRTVGLLDAWTPLEAERQPWPVVEHAEVVVTRSVVGRILPWAAGLAAGIVLAGVVAFLLAGAERERVLEEIAHERQVTLTALEETLTAWATEQDLRHDALVRGFEDARAQDLEQVAAALDRVAAGAAQDTAQTRQTIDEVIRFVANDTIDPLDPMSHLGPANQEIVP